MNGLIARLALAALVIGAVGLGLAHNGDEESAVPNTHQESGRPVAADMTERASHDAMMQGGATEGTAVDGTTHGGMIHDAMTRGADHDGMMQMREMREMMEMMAHCSSMMEEMQGDSSGHGMGNRHRGDEGSGTPR